MMTRILSAAAIGIALSLSSISAFAAATDYSFEPVASEMKKGDDVVVTLRLVHKPTGKLVSDAVIIRKRVDMAPDGMAEMESPAEPVAASEPGTYAFKTDLPMAGRYQFSLAAKVQGEPETVVSRVIIKAVK
jgi:YtkA-like protein